MEEEFIIPTFSEPIENLPEIENEVPYPIVDIKIEPIPIIEEIPLKVPQLSSYGLLDRYLIKY